MADREEVQSMLDAISPAGLSYGEWLNVGMALENDGLPMEMWDTWSRRDQKRYHSGECAEKWKGFHGAESPVTISTVAKMARDSGWRSSTSMETLDWDSEIVVDQAPSIVNRDWLEDEEIREPKDYAPADQLIDYLETLFQPNERVGYVMSAMWREEEGKPGKGVPSNNGRWDRTRDELIEAIKANRDDISFVIGDVTEHEGKPLGAWIRFNPLNGEGAKDENVTEFRYALVESDTLPIGEQYAILKQLELPIAALVHSGGKSLHAIVRIGADSLSEYRKRVNFLYEVCEKNGLIIDQNNKNPSRLSRMPGIPRGDGTQFLVATNIGKPGWDAWKEHIDDLSDDLPPFTSLSTIWDNMPELTAPLIDGVLRKGHKMLISGPSKAGKSYALIQLCISLAEGRQWMERFLCARGRVAYVNLELDETSCYHRFKDIYEAKDWAPERLGNIDIWNLRGKAVPMDRLAAPLIRRTRKGDYVAVVIDPIYKVITGDENAADKMAAFCNYFDRVCTEVGCAVIYCHHHSKGAQGGKRAMDRASGSGVFARDPDALLDLLEVTVTPQMYQEAIDAELSGYCVKALNARGLLGEVPSEELGTASSMLARCQQLLPPEEYDKVVFWCADKRKKIEGRTAFRLEATLREFAPFKPINVWFEYPVHFVDTLGILEKAKAMGDWTSEKQLKPKKTKEELEQEKRDAVLAAIDQITEWDQPEDFTEDGGLKLSAIIRVMKAQEIPITDMRTLKKYLPQDEQLVIANGVIRKRAQKGSA